MAGPHIHHNTGEALRALTDGSNTLIPIPALLCAPTPTPTKASAPAQVFALAQVPTLALGQPSWCTNEDLQRTIKLVLESFIQGQEYGQLQANSATREWPLKTWFPNLY